MVTQLQFTLDSHHSHLLLDVKEKYDYSLTFIQQVQLLLGRLRWNIVENVYDFEGL